MASFGIDGNNLGIAFHARSNSSLLAAQNSAADVGASRGTVVRHGPMTTGSHGLGALEPLSTNQLPQLPPPVRAQPAAAQHHTVKTSEPVTALASTSMPTIPPALTPSQRGELELARTRAERVAAGRSRVPAGGGYSGASAGLTAGTSGAGSGGTKRHRGVSVVDMSLPNSEDDEDGGGDHSEGELELSRLSPEEQERVLTARLASGGTGSSDKDARRLKRLLRNRVSAQQARERKKQYVSSLEDQIRDQQTHIALLEKRLEMLESQNEALRNIIMTMRGFVDNPTDGAGVGAGGGPMGQSPGSATRPPAGPAAGQLPAPRGVPQPWQEGRERGTSGLFGRGGAMAVQPAAMAAAPPHMVPLQPDHVVPELPSSDHRFPLLSSQNGVNDSEQLQRHELQQVQAQVGGQLSELSPQRRAPRTRQSRTQLLDTTSDPVVAAAAVAGASVLADGRSLNESLQLPQQLLPANGLQSTDGRMAAEVAVAAPQFQDCIPQDGIGSGGSPNIGTGTGIGSATAAAYASPVAHFVGAVHELRYASPALGQLSPFMLVPGSSDAEMPYSEDFGNGCATRPRVEGELLSPSNAQFMPP
ncbi:hypothetical protein VaNZ11_002031 [Volvox africanus]|uniref:BZIP domain-containing protein n=1 Tax=Volvox africanus TaxID=51714 RepID=A0ABQ5RQY1_9CHLO|nr:hypothetical protein VaNZ11_002031 [Volvox africanus]